LKKEVEQNKWKTMKVLGGLKVKMNIKRKEASSRSTAAEELYTVRHLAYTGCGCDPKDPAPTKKKNRKKT
jgi:hypothetical protein